MPLERAGGALRWQHCRLAGQASLTFKGSRRQLLMLFRLFCRSNAGSVTVRRELRYRASQCCTNTSSAALTRSTDRQLMVHGLFHHDSRMGWPAVTELEAVGEVINCLAMLAKAVVNKSHNKSTVPICPAGKSYSKAVERSAGLHRQCIGKCIQSIQTGWDDYGRPLVLTIPRRRSHKSGELWDGKLPARD